MAPIFISYRRSDAEGYAGRLFRDLADCFGAANVFLDVTDIAKGRDFRTAIDETLSSCQVVLCIIGPRWCDVTDEDGKRRLDDPGDYVRIETATALKRQVPLVPVLVGGAHIPKAYQLPEDVKELAFRSAVEITHARWDSDVKQLIRDLEPYVGELASAQRTVLRRRKVALMAAVVPAVVVALGFPYVRETVRPNPDGRTLTLASTPNPQDERKLAAELLAEPIYFSLEHDLAPFYGPLLERKAAVLAVNPSIHVELRGNTDAFRSREYGIALGQKLADLVRRRLLELGVPDSRIATISFGKERPTDQTWPEKFGKTDWDPNRRVDVQYSGDITSAGHISTVRWRSDQAISAVQPWARELTVNLDGATRIPVNLFDGSGLLVYGRQQPSWISSDPTIVSVDRDGLIRGNRLGRAVLHADIGDQVLEIKVTVDARTTVLAEFRSDEVQVCSQVHEPGVTVRVQGRGCIRQFLAGGVLEGHYILNLSLSSSPDVAFVFGLESPNGDSYVLSLSDAALFRSTRDGRRLVIPGYPSDDRSDSTRDVTIEVNGRSLLLTRRGLRVDGISALTRYELPTPPVGYVALQSGARKGTYSGSIEAIKVTDPI